MVEGDAGVITIWPGDVGLFTLFPARKLRGWLISSDSLKYRGGGAQWYSNFIDTLWFECDTNCDFTAEPLFKWRLVFKLMTIL